MNKYGIGGDCVKELYYVGYYSKDLGQRNFVLSATNKMDYIITCLNRLGYRVNIVSPSQGIKGDFKILLGNTTKLNDNVMLKQSFSWTSRSKILEIVKLYWSKIWLFFELTFKIPSNSTVIVYHSNPFVGLIEKVSWFKKLNFILECEEIYNEVQKNRFVSLKREERFVQKFKKYIFPTENLTDRFVKNTGKKAVVVYGSYNLPCLCEEKFADEKIHLVYSGTLEESKGGAITAVSIAEYLDEKYVIHILGFGTDKEKEDLIRKINETNDKSRCKTVFEGLLVGKEYTDFLQKCNIGLSTQTSKGEYANSSFPSKVLTYLSCGLDVVTVRISVLSKAKISKLLHFYDDANPESIAQLIRSIQFSETNNDNALRNLDEEFVSELDKLIMAK